ncbi:MAG: cytochrome c peroxidase [Massilia sp.]
MNGRAWWRAAAALPVLLASGQCLAERDGWTPAERTVMRTLHIDALPAAPADPSNAYEGSVRAAALGKRLFFDKRLSANGQVACASCHDPALQFQDGRALAQGVATGQRRTMPVVGSGHGAWQFWDGRKDSVWAQALGPLEDAKEHGGNRLAHARVTQQHYRTEYETVFGAMPSFAGLPDNASPVGTKAERAAWDKLDESQRTAISRVFANMGKAIAAYEKTLAHAPSRLDNYIGATLRDDPAAASILTAPEKRGLRLFIGKASCVSCHGGPLLSDQHFHNTGVAPHDLASPEMGRSAAIATVLRDPFNCLGPFSDARPRDCGELAFIATDDRHMDGAFKTPSLRNVALRAPYMHAGQIASLEQVVRHYVKAPRAAIGHSERSPMALSEQEIADLVAFLGTLSGAIKEN